MKGEKGVAIVDQGGTLDSSIFKQGIQVVEEEPPSGMILTAKRRMPPPSFSSDAKPVQFAILVWRSAVGCVPLGDNHCSRGSLGREKRVSPSGSRVAPGDTTELKALFALVVRDLQYFGDTFKRGNSASFIQASPSRLSESCRSSFLVFGSRCSLKQPVLGLSDIYSRLGENGSPKRGRNEACEELCVLSELTSRSGEKSSLKRDEVVQPLLHARSSEPNELEVHDDPNRSNDPDLHDDLDGPNDPNRPDDLDGPNDPNRPEDPDRTDDPNGPDDRDGPDDPDRPTNSNGSDDSDWPVEPTLPLGLFGLVHVFGPVRVVEPVRVIKPVRVVGLISVVGLVRVVRPVLVVGPVLIIGFVLFIGLVLVVESVWVIGPWSLDLIFDSS
ncbi:hypothetical protein DEO72_LG8g2407 [Vigna unguiculata]|uniref:Thrombospondin-related anonymous protein n=1 Tax=Vigna unguiculata TaxID=3917 RepID=A0A4D6MUR6_VIGUN|nr:hypothetical protein DEO72_LG8g2407 [Vigna unguiculata]